MKKFVVLISLLIFGNVIFAQDATGDKWKNGGTCALQFSQAAMKNWMAGGVNAMALNFGFNYFMNYEV